MKAKRFYKHTKKNTHEKGKRVLNTAVMIAAPIVLLVYSGYAALHARFSRTEGFFGFLTDIRIAGFLIFADELRIQAEGRKAQGIHSISCGRLRHAQ